jgi:hypothetical protein
MKIQTLAQGAQFTGRTVEYVDSSGEKFQGVVESASIKDGELMLRINDKDISIDAVTSILDPVSA